MRIALVTPYSWTYPGGVNRHVEALALELDRRGHEARVLAPWDPDDRRSRLMHRSAPKRIEMPDYLVPLGRTVGWPANDGVSNLSVFPEGVSRMRNELRTGGYDVVHVHAPVAPVPGWIAPATREAPVVGTFHSYSSKLGPNYAAVMLGARRVFNQLHARIAVSEAAAWTGRRFFGGRYRIIPNGVDLASIPTEPKPDNGGRFEIAFVGRAEERKGLPTLIAAFEALSEHADTHLTVVGANADEVARFVSDPELMDRVNAVGSIPHGERFWRILHRADVLCAPSLPRESFGMVLIEAFATSTPVVATEIAGYREVVTDGVDGLLVPAADAQAMAESLHELQLNPQRRRAMGAAARESAERYAWPRIADEVSEVYERALEAPEPAGGVGAFARRVGFAPADGSVPAPPERLPTLDPEPELGTRRGRTARRAGLGVAALAGAGLTWAAASRIGIDQVLHKIVNYDEWWVLIASALMVASLFSRAISWLYAMRSAMPDQRFRRRDVTSATMIGVLMSATLPARAGEPARAMIMARRTHGRIRDTLPVILGTIVSQTVLNLAALALLGLIIVSTTDLFSTSSERIFIASLAPVLILIAVVLGPSLVRRSGSGRISRGVRAVRDALARVRSGLHIFRDPRHGPVSALAQLTAWGIQLLSVYALAVAVGLEHQIGIGGAAAVLFAVNVTAVVPATPSNIGVFQLATVSVLTTGFGVSAADALAFGVVLQGIEIATSVSLGLPALVREGLSWSDVRMRALSAAPVELPARRAADFRETA